MPEGTVPRVGNEGRTPVPDPTILTTEALLREIGHLRDYMLAATAGLEDRFDAYERAHETKHRERATEVEKAIQHLTELAAERFAGVSDRFSGIQLQLAERDARIQESTQASKDAIAAALAAQKEAVTKSELNTKEQIAAITTQNATTVASLESKIENVKELITGAGNVQAGATGRTAGLDLAASRTLTVVGIVAVILGIVVGYLATR
jgi:hypothetical protein